MRSSIPPSRAGSAGKPGSSPRPLPDPSYEQPPRSPGPWSRESRPRGAWRADGGDRPHRRRACRGRRIVTAVNTSAQFWINLQQALDLYELEQGAGELPEVLEAFKVS